VLVKESTVGADEVNVKKVKGQDPPETVEGRIEEMERKLDRLRSLYESFFMGVERAPPNTPRRELNRLMLETQQVQIGNASMRFRFQALMQRWVVLTAYWNRTLREIEAGTYRRDLARAQRHLAEKGGGAMTEQDAINLGIPASRAKAFVDRQQKMSAARAARAGAAAPAAPAGAAAAPPPAPLAAPRPSSLPGISDPDLENVYRRYLETHRKVNDPRPPLTLDNIRDRLSKQLPKIMAEKNCRKVTLDVAVEDGKVRLKAWPVIDKN
jgi:hypothetical protein